ALLLEVLELELEDPANVVRGEGGGDVVGDVGNDPVVRLFDVEQRRGWRLGDAPRLVHHEIRRDRDDQSDHEKPGDHRHRRRSLGATHQGPALLASSSSRRAAPVSSCSARRCAGEGDRSHATQPAVTTTNAIRSSNEGTGGDHASRVQNQTVPPAPTLYRRRFCAKARTCPTPSAAPATATATPRALRTAVSRSASPASTGTPTATGIP